MLLLFTFIANRRGGYHPPEILPPPKGEVDFARRAKDGRVLNAFPKGLSFPANRRGGYHPPAKPLLFTVGRGLAPAVKIPRRACLP